MLANVEKGDVVLRSKIDKKKKEKEISNYVKKYPLFSISFNENKEIHYIFLSKVLRIHQWCIDLVIP